MWIDISQIIASISILVIAVWAFKKWTTNTNSAARTWFLLSMVTLAVVALLAAFFSRGALDNWSRVFTTFEFVVLACFPFCLYQFAASFYKPKRKWRIFALGVLIAAVFITSWVPAEYFTSDYPTPDWFPYYIGGFFLYWIGFSGVVALRLWIGGKGQPTVIRRRMRTLAIGAIGTIATLAVGFLVPSNEFAGIGTEIILISSVLLLALGYDPPSSIRRSWRQDAEAQLRQATVDFLQAKNQVESAQLLLPQALRIIGASSAGWYKASGEKIAAIGEEAPENTKNMLPIPHNPHASGDILMGNNRIEMNLKDSRLIFWVNAYTPFFGYEEIDIVKQVGLFFDLSGEREKRQMEEDKRLQAETVSELLAASVIPEKIPEIVSLKLGAVYEPAEALSVLGGDWYDAFEFAPHQVLLVVGDVMGKGVEAAAIMTQIRNGLRAYIMEKGTTPASALYKLNHLCIRSNPATMATVWAGVWDIKNRTITAASAGHPPPLITDGNSATLWEFEAGVPIGVMENSQYQNYTKTLKPNNQIVAYTDGLVEKRGKDIQEGLDKAVSWWQWDEPQKVAENMVGKARQDGAGGDDIAVLVIMPVAATHLHIRTEAKPEQLIRMRVALNQWLSETLQVYETTDDGTEKLSIKEKPLHIKAKEKPAPPPEIATNLEKNKTPDSQISEQTTQKSKTSKNGYNKETTQKNTEYSDKPPFLVSKEFMQEISFNVIFAAGEAISNSVEHAYSDQGWIEVEAYRDDKEDMIWVICKDGGKWRPQKDRDRGRGKFLMQEMSDVFERDIENGTTVKLGFRIKTIEPQNQITP